MTRLPRLLRPLHALHAQPRLWGSALAGVAVYLLLPLVLVGRAESRVLVAWNFFALLYLVLVWQMARGADPAAMRRRALQQDEGRFFVLALVVMASLAVLAAIASQLGGVKELSGLQKTRHVALAALTIVTAWAFTQTLFALHYAHDFYLARSRGLPDALIFPGTADPNYRDFLYFACVIGTSGQTADVSFNGSTLRGVGLVHCVLAFFFNATMLGLTMNVAAGMF